MKTGISLGPRRVVAVVCLAGLAVSCTGKSEDKSGSTPAGQMSTRADCGRDVATPEDGLLSVQDVWASGGRNSRSARTTELSDTTCSATKSGVTAPAGSCETAGFPWGSSAATLSQELYNAGVRRHAQSTLKGSNEASLKEQVLIPVAEKSGKVLESFRKHLEGCGAKVLSTQNGKASQFVLSGSPTLVVSLQGGRITALQGYGASDWKDGRLENLLGTAENRSGRLDVKRL